MDLDGTRPAFLAACYPFFFFCQLFNEAPLVAADGSVDKSDGSGFCDYRYCVCLPIALSCDIASTVLICPVSERSHLAQLKLHSH